MSFILTTASSFTNHFSAISHRSLPQTRISVKFSSQLFYLGSKKMILLAANHSQFRCHSINSHSSAANESSDTSSTGQRDSVGKENQEESLTTDQTLKRLKRYGISGLLSYGLLNTVYYLCTFLFVWLYVAPAPGRMGYIAAAQRFLKILAMVWAGSQVTKLVRAGGALALAPVVDRALSWFTLKFKFESQEKAFMAIVGFCFGVALVLFLIVTLLWA